VSGHGAHIALGYKRPVKLAIRIAVPCVVLSLASVASATPPATPGQRHAIPGRPALPPTTYTPFDLTFAQATAQIAQIATWDVTMQSTFCTDPDAGLDASATACERGGIIEVQSGPGMAIVASDNTQETIGIWAYDEKLNGVAHASNTALAFGYLATHPGYLAWRVAGDTGPDYYSVYNCGWGVRAVMLYEATTGDMSQHAYGLTCANHIAMYAPGLVSDGQSLLNVGPAGWASSGLWLWGDTYGDASMKTAAAGIGAQVKSWIETAPATNLSVQMWAMTGSAPFYGVIESYMKENPTELTAWVSEYAPMLGGWVDESVPDDPNDWTDWRNAWAGWNMLAQFTSAQVLGAKAGNANELIAQDILTKLVAQAGPTSGAIPGSQQRPSTEAESWITAYMLYFGLLEDIHDFPIPDAGAEAGAKDAGVKDAGVDGAVARDASTPPPHDAAGDAASAGDTGGGCSCVAAGGGRESTVPLGALVGLLLLAARRRAVR
jgi:MYXO-CTERM domain-containing protein